MAKWQFERRILVGGLEFGTCFFYFPRTIGNPKSSQLTNSNLFQRGPKTSDPGPIGTYRCQRKLGSDGKATGKCGLITEEHHEKTIGKWWFNGN